MSDKQSIFDSYNSGLVRSSIRRLSRRWLIALGLIGVVLIAGHVVMEVTLWQKRADAKLINVAGRQRMLSQRIVSKAAALVESRAQGDREREVVSAGSLAEAINVFAASHTALVERDPQVGLGGSNSAAAASLFDRLDSPYEAIVAEGRAILHGDRSSAGHNDLAALERASDTFLPIMHEIVGVYEAHSIARLGHTRMVGWASVLVVLGVSIGAALWIVRPMLRRSIDAAWRAEEALEEARQASREADRLAAFARLSTNIMVRTGTDRRILWVNEGFEKISGYTLEECFGRSPAALLQCEKTDPQTVSAMRHALSNGEGFRGRILNRSKSGRDYWLDLEIIPESDEHGQLTGFIAVESDVTELVEAKEQATRAAQLAIESRQRLSSIYEALSEGIVLMDTNGDIVDCNPAAEVVLGIPRDQIVGRTPRDPRWRVIREDGSDLPSDEMPAVRTLRTGESVQGFVHGIVRDDGQTRWVSISSQPINEQDGSFRGVVASITDITVQYEQRREITAQKQLLEAALDSPSTGFWDWKISEKIEHYSPSLLRMLGYEPGELPETPDTWQQLIHSDDLQATMKSFTAHIETKGQEPFYNKVRYRHKDGSTVWVLCIGRVFEWSPQGEPLRMAGCHIDVTAAQQAEQRILEIHDSLAAAQKRYELALEGSRDAIFDWDVNLGKTYYSTRWAELLNLPGMELEPSMTTLFEYTASADVQRVEFELNTFVRKGGTHLECEFQMMTHSGNVVWVLLRAAARRRDDGIAERVCGSVADITSIKAAEEEMRRLVQQDQLTGLASRTKLMERLEHALARSERTGKHCAVLFFDFDRFKVVNDSLGHHVGDKLLCSIADRLSSNIRVGDTAARFGGDEFVILLEGLSGAADARIIADKLLDVCGKPHDIEGHQLISTASIGLVTTHLPTKVGVDLLRDADAAMYQAKSSGRGRVVEFDRAMHENSLERLDLEKEIRIAIETDQFSLHYQPIVNLESGQPIGAEALARWDHPQRGPVSPGVFIPIAEESNQMQALGDLVLRHACEQIQIWKHRQVTPPGFAVSVNFSKVQLVMPDFPEYLSRIVQEYGIQPSDIKIEVTETTIVDNRAGVGEVLKEIREKGFVVMMDDFGTGQSSYSGLHTLPIDELKIDQSFIRHLQMSRELIAITSSIVTLAANLSLRTIGEGIEDAGHVALLQDLGCDYGQGYFFSRPLPAIQFEDWLVSQSDTKAA